MANQKRLVLFVEGEGEEKAAPALVKRLITELGGWDCVMLDQAPFRIGGVSNLFGKQAANWENWLKAAAKRRNFGGVLLLQDGDSSPIPKQPFCAMSIGRDLVTRAQTVGAGSMFSVACVFAMQEYESWLIAGVESLAGKPLADGGEGIAAGTIAPAGDLEAAPRDAKGWLTGQMPVGYSPTTHQAEFTNMVDLDKIRARNLRSFSRLESAVRELIEAFRSGQHIATPHEAP